jgi:hypothetical protein
MSQGWCRRSDGMLVWGDLPEKGTGDRYWYCKGCTGTGTHVGNLELAEVEHFLDTGCN